MCQTRPPFVSELRLHNRQLRVYSNLDSGFENMAINGYNLVKVIDDFIHTASEVSSRVSDKFVPSCPPPHPPPAELFSRVGRLI